MSSRIEVIVVIQQTQALPLWSLKYRGETDIKQIHRYVVVSSYSLRAIVVSSKGKHRREDLI